jgi:hypothetical protein
MRRPVGCAAPRVAKHARCPGRCRRTLRGDRARPGSVSGELWFPLTGSVGETRAVRQWADGDREPGEDVRNRLRVALQVALPLAEAESPQIAQVWFQGLNPQLNDRSPARILREGELGEVGPSVIAAARAFLVGG